MSCTLIVQTVRVGARCLVLLGAMTGAALAQITGTVNPSAAPAETPAGVCKPIGLTASGETVFPFQCKEFIERQKAANPKSAAERNQKPAAAEDKTAEAKPVTAERKPAAAEEKPPAVKEKAAAKQPDSVVPESGKPAASEPPGTIPLPRRAKREARGRSVGPAGCTRFRTYDSASGTYRAYDGQRRQCREMVPTATATEAALPASRIPLPPDSPKATPPSETRAAAVDSSATPATIPDSRTSVTAVTAVSTASVPVANSPPVVDHANSNTRTIEAQVAAATMVAEHLTVATAAPPPDTNGTNPDKPGRAEARGEKSAPASANDTDLLVAVLVTRPDITSVSALTGKTIAIDDKYSAANGSVRTAIVAAGASEIQLSGGQATAITRLVNGEVPAAIVALVSADAAEGFPDIKGFKILHVPLSPRSLEARP